jgi:hypothetical protein
MPTAHARSAAEAPAGLTRGPAGAIPFIISYPQPYTFDLQLLPEHKIAEAHITAGRFENITAEDVALLRAQARPTWTIHTPEP